MDESENGRVVNQVTRDLKKEQNKEHSKKSPSPNRLEHWNKVIRNVCKMITVHQTGWGKLRSQIIKGILNKAIYKLVSSKSCCVGHPTFKLLNT